MIPVVFINTSTAPYVDMIMSGRKTVETRSRDMLRALVGKRVLIAETGHGKPVVRCSARISVSMLIVTRKFWDLWRYHHCVPEGSRYDWKKNTRCKWLYLLRDVHPLRPFHPAEGVRHGRVWMEYNGKEVL